MLNSEEVRELTYALTRVGVAITPNVAGSPDVYGNHVTSLTEAVMGRTEGFKDLAAASELGEDGLSLIADAINNLAESVRESSGST